jgi:peptidoglycan/LPS O-acetylase OafA/YrhL
MIGIGSIRLLLAVSVLLLHADVVPFPVAQIAVLTFFYISGFLMERSLKRYATWQGFILNRLLRLLPTFLLISVATWLIIVNSSEEFRQSFGFIYLREASSYSSEAKPPISAFAAMEFQWETPYLGFESELVPQAWSIGNEIVYYATVPLLALMRLRGLITLVCISLAFLGTQLWQRGDDFDYIIYTNILAMYSFFLAGNLTSRFLSQGIMVETSLKQVSRWLVPALIIGSYFLQPSDYHAYPVVIGYTLILSLFITLGFFAEKEPSGDVEPAFSRLLGGASYPLYMSHMIVIGCLNYLSLLHLPILIITSLSLALVIHLLLDRPLERWRGHFRARSI